MGLFSGIIKGVGQFIGAKKAKKGIRQGVEAQNEGIDQQNALLKEQFDRTQEQFAPFRETGTQASTALSKLLSGDLSGFKNSPDFIFARNEALDAVNDDFSAAGAFGSGARAKALQDRAAGVASQSLGGFRDFVLRAQGQGLNATNAGSAFGTNIQRLRAQGLADKGETRASGFIAKGNVNQQLISGLANTAGGLTGDLSKLFKKVF